MFLSEDGPTLKTLDSLSISAVHQPFSASSREVHVGTR